MNAKLIAIVGQTGVGKTFLLRKYQHPNTIYVDDYIKTVLYARDTSVFKAVVATFGTSIVSGSHIDTRRLGSIVLNDRQKLEKLTTIVNPAVKEFLSAIPGGTHLVEIATYLKYESYFKPLFSEVVLIVKSKPDLAAKFPYLKHRVSLLPNRTITASYLIDRDQANADKRFFKLLDKLVSFN